MPAKKTINKKPADQRLPEGYDGPAFELADGRVLFVEKYVGRIWSMVYLEQGVSRFYKSVATAKEHRSEADARKALIKYGAEKGLKPVNYKD